MMGFECPDIVTVCKFAATGCAGMFAGAGLYGNCVHVPAMTSIKDTASLRQDFKVMFLTALTFQVFIVYIIYYVYVSVQIV